MSMLEPPTCSSSTSGAAASRRPGRRVGTHHQGPDRIAGAPRNHSALLDSHDLLLEVEASVAALPPRQRVALVQRKYHDRNYAEIAASLCCSEAAARASVYEALRTLRDRLGDRL